jgi:DNA-binding response OmpR family regulator
MSERPCKVLVVDTDPDVLILLQRVLEDARIDTTVTWDYGEARTLVENTPFDVILVGDHPAEAAKKFLTDACAESSRPCLILRTTPSERDADYFFRFGVTGVVPKREPVRVLEQVQRYWHRKAA